MRPLRIVLFAFGTIAGFGFAFHSIHDHCARRDSFERHVADLCVDAARRAGSQGLGPAQPSGAWQPPPQAPGAPAAP